MPATWKDAGHAYMTDENTSKMTSLKYNVGVKENVAHANVMEPQTAQQLFNQLVFLAILTV
jgi:hypothetical protein